MDITAAIILAGGKGTRLPLSARDIPKALVDVGGRPILAHQIDWLVSSGFERIRLALGHRAEAVISFADGAGYRCEYMVEPEPLGTGGAVKFASHGLTEPFLVLNGDILADFDFAAIIRSHQPDTALLVSHWRDDASDFGLLEIDGEESVREFREKPERREPGHINAGCYILHPEDVHAVPQRAFMLEQELFPKLAAAGRLKPHIHRGWWEDLGTEERLERARSVFAGKYG